MIDVVGIRFRQAGKIYFFDPVGLEIDLYDHVIVETIRGIEYGQVVVANKTIREDEIISTLKPVIRVATEEDIAKNAENKRKADEAYHVFKEKVIEHDLNMKLIYVEYTFDGNKILFYFTADKRIDFRDLVKDLAAIYKTRIELRQIGVRDEAKYLGAVGYCGRETCCSTHLCEFKPVSIKMAKDQNISLNPTKISGVCGRLMCCMRYEQEGYEYLLKKMPKIGAIVKTEEGRGVVIQNSALQQIVRVRVETEDGIKMMNFPIDEVHDTGAVDKNYVTEDEDIEVDE
ncbi:MAG: stage 0 sporulation family protein [Tissierellia bacterium]|nr:stage 0 sporulation family protein [Tissierellia bacterium]